MATIKASVSSSSLTRSPVSPARLQAFSCRPVIASPARNVAVFAKGKGRMVKSQPDMLSQITGPPGIPPTPEVDPENAEFVIFVRAKKYRSVKTEMTNSPWVPLSVVKGGQAANALVIIMESEWGRKLFSKTLVSNIAAAVYKERLQVERSLRANVPYFKDVPGKEIEYAFKVRDPKDPVNWYKANDLTMCPPETKLGKTALDNLKAFFSPESISSMFIAPTPPADMKTIATPPAAPVKVAVKVAATPAAIATPAPETAPDAR